MKKTNIQNCSKLEETSESSNGREKKERFKQSCQRISFTSTNIILKSRKISASFAKIAQTVTGLPHHKSL